MQAMHVQPARHAEQRGLQQVRRYVHMQADGHRRNLRQVLGNFVVQFYITFLKDFDFKLKVFVKFLAVPLRAIGRSGWL